MSPLLAVSGDCDAHAAAVKLYTRGKEQVTGRRLRGHSLHAPAGPTGGGAGSPAVPASPNLAASAGKMRIDSGPATPPHAPAVAGGSSASSSSSISASVGASSALPQQGAPPHHHSVREYMSPDLRSWMLHRALLSTGCTGVEAVDAKLSGGLSQLPLLHVQPPASAPASPELALAPAHAGFTAHPPPARLAQPPPALRTPASSAHHGPAAMGPPLYDLCAVIQHIGASLSSGHYIAHVRHRASGAWFTIDDASVRSIAPGEVAKKEAYVLFYSRQVPAPGSGAEGGAAAAAPDGAAPSAAARSAPGPCPLPAALPSEPVYCFVSRQWWSRYCSVAVPGPVSCGDVLCDHGAVKRQLADRIRE